VEARKFVLDHPHIWEDTAVQQFSSSQSLFQCWTWELQKESTRFYQNIKYSYMRW